MKTIEKMQQVMLWPTMAAILLFVAEGFHLLQSPPWLQFTLGVMAGTFMVLSFIKRDLERLNANITADERIL